ncbi:CHAT domain-containing protein [Nostoc sp. CENA67]|uniref:CHAT domain-containing protein n=1 Tax=Amazonocrinis nigriterrae CENA67 TaxID=2794033 RepID=A0A8J7HT01_9NOST|nr:tetratricopeptide repeat protein [Amazonocrinis nigriterrae]MBH8565152.1 CHAT domain-containing protein [Amazonocrinis nigriterrae CENA67]
MLTQLVQWLKTFSKRPVGSQQTRDLRTVKDQQVVEPPQLSNADLELLFNQLLEGVHQGRGQQWAINYLQRMEDRISLERWIDWLLSFGEKLLLSPAPNHQLAMQMVQLGELDIGKVGELSYDIGIRLLTLNSSEWYEDNEEPQTETSTTEDFEASETLFNSPGQELIRNLGELLWESDDLEVEPTSAVPEISTPEEISAENIKEVIWEYQAEPIETTAVPDFVADEDATENSQEWVYEAAAETATSIPLLPPAEEDVITNLSELSFEYEVRKTEITPAELFAHTLEAGVANFSGDGTWDQSLANLEPNVAYTLDELLVRLDQSAHLVQQLASNLATQTSHTSLNQSNAAIEAQAWFYQGLQQAKTGDLLRAIASYDQAIELNPDAYEYWFNRGLTLFHLKHFTEAIASYNQAIELKPDYYKAWYNRGGTLGELGLFDEAIASFEQAIEIQPDHPEAWAGKGLALLKLGRLWEAVASYDQALLLQPQDQENWYFRGVALAVSEQHEEAIASYDQALAIQPDYHEVWIDRGVVLFNLKRWSDAIASWDKALASQPDFYLAWYNRGIALDNLGRRTEAITSYHKAITIKPDFHLAWYNQAVALFYLKQFTQAIVSYDNALQIKLDYWEAWIGRGTAAGHLDNVDLSLSTDIALTNPALQQGGYEGRLASYEEGLKHVRSDTHPEGWGRLHLAIANAYYDRGRKHYTSYDDWYQALNEYNQALSTLTSEDFPELHLEVVQSMIKVLLSLGEIAQAQELQEYSADILQQLLSEPTRSHESKKQLALKFAGIRQLAVDLYVEYGDLVEAWEMAELGKNSCLTWLLDDWKEEIYSPRYDSVQQLLNPTTAIIYWHISPVGLNTFIIKDQAPSPILVFIPIQNVGTIGTTTYFNELPLPEAVRRLIKFEDWLEDWNQTHEGYRSQAPDYHNKSSHSWRLEMEQRLLKLKDILQISTIEQELEGITQLILIPHRELHRLPLHALFSLSSYQEYLPNLESNFAISYLPSVQIGLSLKNTNTGQFFEQKLLIVEYPNNTSSSTFNFANLESEVVSQMFNSRQRIQGEKANKNIVESALFNNYYNIFHFTGHVTNNCREPQKSELALAGEDKLTLENIYQGNLATYSLVTLSACETTSNQTITTEYVGLVNGFLWRGIPHVVSTLWTVESSASALVIIEFYRRLQQENSPTTALAKATLWLKELTAGELAKWYEELLNNVQIEDLKVRAYLATHLYKNSKMPSNKKLYSHPYYWAAFTISGK